MSKNQSLAVKYRPKTFDDLTEQESIKTILTEQVNSRTFKQAYCFTGASGCGKAQPLYSNILTPNGYIKMGNINLGDEVFDGAGNKCNVTGIFPQGARDTYRIHFNDKTFIDVSDEHLNEVYVYNNKKKKNEHYTYDTKTLLKLFNTNKYDFRVTMPIIKAFNEQELLVDPYLLGALIGDGSLSGNFSFCNGESDVLEKVKTKLNNFGYTLQYKSGVDYFITRIDRTPTNQFIANIKNSFRKQLQHYGLMTKSTNKHIPKEYLLSSYENRLELLRGLMDTDGFVDSRGYHSFSTSSKTLSNDFMYLCQSMGIRVTRSEKVAGYRNELGQFIQCNNSYEHYIKTPKNICIVSSNKHAARIKPQQNEPIRSIKNIEYIGKIKCQCIMVDSPLHTYITDNFTPTHNTTSARIFANMINNNKGNPIELDCASNGGVDQIREISENAKKKALDCEYKIFILDEAHLVSSQGWGAFLKLIEEPPKYAIFIFATTNPEKIPVTILNRVQRYNFNKISTNKIFERLKYIAEQENINVEDNVLQFIAKNSGGGMREAITSLDKCISLNNNLTLENVCKALGNVEYETQFELTEAIANKDEKQVLQVIEEVNASGKDLKLFVKQYQNFMVDVCKIKLFDNFTYSQLPELDKYKEIIKTLNKEKCVEIMDLFIKINEVVKWESNPLYIIEALLLNYMKEV